MQTSATQTGDHVLPLRVSAYAFFAQCFSSRGIMSRHDEYSSHIHVELSIMELRPCPISSVSTGYVPLRALSMIFPCLVAMVITRYTVFQEASESGMPIMRPLWVQYPLDPKTFDMDDQWMVGSDILVKPVTTEGTTSIAVYFPAVAGWAGASQGEGRAERWYDVDTMIAVAGLGAYRTVQAPLEKIPVFQRGGSIVPRYVAIE